MESDKFMFKVALKDRPKPTVVYYP